MGWPDLRSRLGFWWSALRASRFGWVVGLVTALGVYDLFVAQFLSPEDAAEWPRVANVIPLSPWTWEVVLLVLLLIAVLEGTYRRWREDRTRLSQPSIELAPRVEKTDQYGPNRDQTAFYVQVHASARGDGVCPSTRGRLVSLVPLSDDPHIRDHWDVKAGPLQWSSREWAPPNDGGGTVTLTRAGADLDVLALENCDSWGRVVYLNPAWREHGDPIHLDVAPWRATIEVASDSGSIRQCVFDIHRGDRTSRNPLVIPSSPGGTLYGPRVEPVDGSEGG